MLGLAVRSVGLVLRMPAPPLVATVESAAVWLLHSFAEGYANLDEDVMRATNDLIQLRARGC